MKRSLIRVTACTLALVTTTAFSADTFPHLATYDISGPQDYYSSAHIKQLSTVQLAVLSYWPGWGKSAHTTMNDTVKKIQALNPNTKVFLYERPESQHIPAEASFGELYNKITNEGWWLTTSGTGGAEVLSDYGNGQYLVNTTQYARKDSSGKTWIQWYPTWLQQNYVAPNPAIAGLYTDNVFYKPRRSGDWDLNGSSDNQNDATTQKIFRQGLAQFADNVRAATGKLVMANTADWGLSISNIAEYQGKYNGGLIEHFIGRSYSVETSAGWGEMMKMYRKVMGALAAPKYGICAVEGSVTDYQTMRYGLASCTMDDGYFAYTDSAHLDHGVPWFDEYSVNLGKAKSGPSTSAWQSGVYRRDFENGIVLVNPKGNGTRTVTLETSYVKIRGTQASVNNGATVRTVTLKDRDGIVLLRVGANAQAAISEAPPALDDAAVN
jgi:hypothetical protein